ncbi:MAG TPA: M23 family peptidase [Rhodobacteraceae bacterium]|nr:M23 family peptidase [Paracoccaceae bacterium]
MKNKLAASLEKRFPEKRLFLRSENETRFVRLSPTSQLLAWSGIAVFVGWTIVATSFLLLDSIGSGSVREQARREQALYEQRLNELSAERDLRAEEALMAQNRFNKALEQISQMQVLLLESEDRRKEFETGIEIIQATLRRTLKERDAALEKADLLLARLESEQIELEPGNSPDGDMATTVDFLAQALESTAQQRDEQLRIAARAEALAAELELERKLLLEKNDRIFAQLEDAVSLSLEPLDKMFEAVGLSTDSILNTVRQGYSGQGGPLTPISFSTRGEAPDADSMRANEILARMDKINLYRIASEKIPFAMPVKASFRYTSGFGQRSGRLHAGTDMAGPIGTPLYATADGVVTFAGRQSGYGLLVTVRHDFGFETRYAHQSKIRVKVGQRVSRGDRIGDMGNSGRSTGPHLHYEVRLDGKPINPMTFIKAARDVF